ncbi:hypothetical protein K7432_006034 [Basidiobolus ranarum]|uniref:Uncharacterized protein n=1 Tax=Basidiobolus ranarum TaxID=34480 RepID=A0ABR2WVJ3_9FUNG
MSAHIRTFSRVVAEVPKYAAVSALVAGGIWYTNLIVKGQEVFYFNATKQRA